MGRGVGRGGRGSGGDDSSNECEIVIGPCFLQSLLLTDRSANGTFGKVPCDSFKELVTPNAHSKHHGYKTMRTTHLLSCSLTAMG